jgi:hypothetical protein
MTDNATNGGSQTAARESDAVIVPKIAGNAEVGKDAHTGRTCPRDTFTIRRDRRKKMATKLDRIREMSANNPKLVFTSLYHLINKELLLECHKEMDGNKATGVDEVTKAE